MSTIAKLEPAAQYQPATSVAPDEQVQWSTATKIAFRFCFSYFGLYVLLTQMLPSAIPTPGWRIPDLGETPPMRALVDFVGKYILRLSAPISHAPSGSGDKMYDWVQAFTMLLLATIITVVWTVIAKERREHTKLYKWFRLFMRIALGTTFLTYGFAKIVPLQMPTLSLNRLVEPFGNFSPMGVLWTSIGASPAYEIITGSVEVLAGALLLIPRTALLGSLVALMAATQVFILNMTYDVPVKLFAFHLILFSLVLLAYNAERLFDLFIRFRPSAMKPEPGIGRKSAIAQSVFCLYVLGMFAYGSAQGYKLYGGGAPRSPLFGIWEVDRMVVDGVDRPPLLTDTTRFRRFIFQYQQGMSLQRPNDRLTGMGVKFDSAAKTITLSSADTTKPKSVLAYSRPTKEHLVLDGTFDGHPTRFELTFRDPDSFQLRSRGFHFISERPFQR